MSSLGQGVFEKGYVEGEQSGFVKGEQSGFVKGEQSGFDKGGKSKEKEIAIRLYKNGCNKQFILNNIEVSEEELNEWLGLNTDDGEVSGMNFFK